MAACNMTATNIKRSDMTKSGTTWYGGDAPSNTTPVLTLGAGSNSYTESDSYVEHGATALDAEDGVIAVGAPSFSPVLDMATAGTYVATYSVTDSGGLTGTITRNVVVSVAGSGPTSTPDLFSDDFEDADFEEGSIRATALNAANFSYTDVTAVSIVTGAAGANEQLHPSFVAVNDSRDWAAKNGSNSMRFRYPSGTNQAELRFSLDPQDDLWIRYWTRVPENFQHGSSSPTNNKFFALWMNAEADYSASGEGSTVAWEFWNDGSGGSDIAFHSSDETFSVMGGHQQFTPFISYPADQGRWMQVVLHVKAATSTSSNDGIIEMHRRWEDEDDFAQIHYTNTADIGVPSGLDAFAFGYFMGYSNPAYSADTEWLIDDVEMSTGSLL